MTLPQPSSTPFQGSSSAQGPLWDAGCKDWAELQEQQCHALYTAVLRALLLPRNTRLLDLGCASGLFAQMAANQGISVTGLDASTGLVDLARQRVPQAAFMQGELEKLPFADGTFDVIAGLNSFQYAASPLNAITESYRVLHNGGKLVMAVWGTPSQCQATTYLRALAALAPPPAPGAPGTFALSTEGATAKLVFQVGFEALTESEVSVRWEYPDEATALRALLSPGPAVKAIQAVGEAKVVRALRNMLAEFRQTHGDYRFENTFRYVIAEKRAPRAGVKNEVNPSR